MSFDALPIGLANAEHAARYARGDGRKAAWEVGEVEAAQEGLGRAAVRGASQIAFRYAGGVAQLPQQSFSYDLRDRIPFRLQLTPNCFNGGKVPRLGKLECPFESGGILIHGVVPHRTNGSRTWPCRSRCESPWRLGQRPVARAWPPNP